MYMKSNQKPTKKTSTMIAYVMSMQELSLHTPTIPRIAMMITKISITVAMIRNIVLVSEASANFVVPTLYATALHAIPRIYSTQH
jgi:hypothetical protein